jgi:SWI/SNF-related matrix-associated actin-dependent regulator of chromatin subfamily A-like protein 1
MNQVFPTDFRITSEKSKYHKYKASFPYDPAIVSYIKTVIQPAFGWENINYNDVDGEKFWAFSAPEIAKLLRDRFPQFQVSGDILPPQTLVEANMDGETDRLERIKSQGTTTFRVKGLKRELFMYQNVGVEFLTQTKGRSMLADEQGIGKTTQAIAYSKHMNYKRILIVTPASVKFVWGDELRKVIGEPSFIIDSKTKLHEIPHDVKYWIINYDILKKHLPQLIKIKFDLLVADESVALKSPTSLRSKAFKALAQNIPGLILISGTPMLSRPVELYTSLNMIDPNTWNNYYSFVRRYCGAKQTPWGLDVSGASNTEELHQRIKKYFIRRRKSEVLKDLPPKLFSGRKVELDIDSYKEYQSANERFADYLSIYQGWQPNEVQSSLTAQKLTQLNALRMICARGKVTYAKELIDEIVDSGHKVLVFCSFNEPLAKLQKTYGDTAVTITGKTSVPERGEIVKRFQEDKTVNVFLGGIKSAGTGITLTAASHVIFIDMPWNPADMEQAIARAHRFGNKSDSINIYDLFVEDTIDADMKEVLETKQGLFDKIIDGKVDEKVALEMMGLATERVMLRAKAK